jgi:hypothetical protein
MERQRGQMLLLSLLALTLVTSWAPTVHAEPFQSYKEKKHRGGSSGDGSSSNDESVNRRYNENQAAEIIGSILSAIAAGPVDETYDRRGSVVEEKKPRALGPCRYEEYHGCLRTCDADDSDCERQCRTYAESICGGTSNASPVLYTYQPSSTDLEYSERAESFFATVEGGAGGVEGGAIGTLEGRFGFSHYGVGYQTSLLFGRGEWLLEGDIGPYLRLDQGDGILAIQPSLMVSLGDDVNNLVGGGARVFAGWQTDGFRGLIRPLFGVIGGQLNVHFRSSIGYRFSRSFFGQIGYDLRVLRSFGGPTESVVHGVFVGFGYQTD